LFPFGDSNLEKLFNVIMSERATETNVNISARDHDAHFYYVLDPILKKRQNLHHLVYMVEKEKRKKTNWEISGIFKRRKTFFSGN
jgi:hypothetical protein